MRKLTVRSLLLAILVLVVSCGAAGPNIKPGTVMGKPAEVSIVAGYINTFAGTMLSDMSLSTSGGAIDAVGNGGYFAFANVPKGPVALAKMVVTDGAPVLSVTRYFEKNKVKTGEGGTPYELEAGGSTETIKGTAEGGFVWLGEFDISQGTGRKVQNDPASYPITLTSKPDASRRAQAVEKLKGSLKGTEWEAVIK